MQFWKINSESFNIHNVTNSEIRSQNSVLKLERWQGPPQAKSNSVKLSCPF